MGDGHETESAVERLLAKLRGEENHFRGRHRHTLAYIYGNCAKDLHRALEEDGVIPSRMK